LSIVWDVFPSYAQQGGNLVVNGNFEEYNNCPVYPGMSNNYLANWSAHFQSPDYYHKCNDYEYEIPHIYGTIEGSDSGYVGISTYINLFSGFQEIIQGGASAMAQVSNLCPWFLVEIGEIAVNKR